MFDDDFGKDVHVEDGDVTSSVRATPKAVTWQLKDDKEKYIEKLESKMERVRGKATQKHVQNIAKRIPLEDQVEENASEDFIEQQEAAAAPEDADAIPKQPISKRKYYTKDDAQMVATDSDHEDDDNESNTKYTGCCAWFICCIKVLFPQRYLSL